MIEKTWIEVPCEKCRYKTPIQIIDVKLQKTICCYNCKISIKLIDKDASATRVTRDLDNALKNLFKF